MRQVELRTKLGAHIAHVDIPEYSEENMPDVVMWGGRCFVVSQRGKEDRVWIYRDAFAVISATRAY